MIDSIVSLVVLFSAFIWCTAVSPYVRVAASLILVIAAGVATFEVYTKLFG